MRNDNYRRKQRHKHICRRLEIIKNVYQDNPIYWCGNDPGRLDKAKIHCSCPMCSAKTRNKRKRHRNGQSFAPSINYKISDQRKVDSMDFDEADYD